VFVSFLTELGFPDLMGHEILRGWATHFREVWVSNFARCWTQKAAWGAAFSVVSVGPRAPFRAAVASASMCPSWVRSVY